ncbi:MAG TPA: succinate dehydrogenase cytochrome b subunit [Acidimicrobiia bacterium]|nr:succinate dehydrogenase cytochrome b subunit [Acidimicrobiia bacterium]
MTSTVPRKRASFPVEFYRSAVGKKWVMAITGFAIIAFSLAHMVGNLKMFLPEVEGRADIDVYGEALRSLFSPIIPEHIFLWILRTGLIVMFALHIHAAYALTLINRRARPEGYRGPVSYVAANYAGRTMRWSGVIFLAFLLFHLADFTWGIQPAAPEAWERGAVYANFIETFNRPAVTFFYVVAMVLLGIHLYHGAWSMFQSTGINHPRFNRLRRSFAIIVAGVICIGFIAPPLAVAFGFLQ